MRGPVATSLAPERGFALMLCWRITWGLVFLAHWRINLRLFGSLWFDGAAEADWSRLFLLSISNLYFVAEVLFGISLRFIHNRRALVVFLLVIAILHAGPISQSVPELISVRDAAAWVGLPTLLVIARLLPRSWADSVVRWFGSRWAGLSPPRLHIGLIPVIPAIQRATAQVRSSPRRGPPIH